MRSSLVSLLSLPAAVLGALTVNLDDNDSIKAAAKLVAQDLLEGYYPPWIGTPGWTLGILPGPPPDGDYYWWQGGAMWGTLLDYYRWTGDDTFNNVTSQALLAQAGPGIDFKNKNWTASLGNDDQAFWGMSAMIAAEIAFEDPPEDQPQWLALAQGVFNDQTAAQLRDGGCGIGLRWQISPYNNGYNYKNTIANACFFNIGARLARYTGNETYERWANETYSWLLDVGYVTSNYSVYDGGYIEDNCTTPTQQQFSYNSGTLLQGAAVMYDYTKSDYWLQEVKKLITAIEARFFKDGVGHEPECEDSGTCTSDMTTYKGFVARWMAYTAKLVPDTADGIMALLKTSAQAAVKTCTGGDNGRQCGFAWSTGVFDEAGAGQQMDVISALTALLALDAPAPVTNSTGGTSQGDPDAGDSNTDTEELAAITTGDKAGAAILTILAIVLASGSLWWMIK
ncbi:glycoside hydrolase family 76 protein [Xylariaceae sp. FL1019]|nr:glycoside hydrolase family 76 protein [Xylariaceae sp. FL1019]